MQTTTPFSETSWQDLREQLLQSLLALPFDAFAACMAHMLTALGYQDVRPTGRQRFLGRNQHGGGSGFDLTMTVPGGAFRRIAIAQVRQYPTDQRVYQRSVDELRGACLRVGAVEALLITTGIFADTVRRDTLAQAPLAPLRLIDGEELVTRLIEAGIGVCTNEDGERVINERYLDGLLRQSVGSPRTDLPVARRQATLRSEAPFSSRETRFLLRMSVAPLPAVRARRRSIKATCS